MDYAALAAQYGGKSEPAAPDYAALAAQFGGKTEAADAAPYEGSRARAQKQSDGILTKALANIPPGFLRGAGSIGATLLYPFDKLGDVVSSITGEGESPTPRNDQRRSGMDAGLAALGADPSDPGFALGKTSGEVAGTMGAGGAIANTLSRVPGAATQIPNLLNAIRTSGMTAGRATPGVVGGTVNTLTRVAGGGVTGGASAGLVDPEHARLGALLGGGAPAAAKLAGETGNLLGSGLRAAVGQASPEVVQLAQRAKQLGINIPADRLVNSKPLDAVASGLNYVPFSGRAGTEARMNSQLNTAASRLMGQNTPNINKALRNASTDLGAKFETTLKSNGVNFDQQLLTDVTDVYNTAERELGSDALKPIASQIDELVNKGASGVIDGQAAYNIKRTLDRIGNGNTPTAYHALQLKGVLMDALNRSLGPTQAAEFALTRHQYGNMLAFEKLAKNGVEGEISVARLANLKNINNPELQELADIAAQFVKPREGMHGAMQRGFAAMGIGTALGPYALAGTAVAGRGANMALNSDTLRATVLGLPRQQAPVGLLGHLHQEAKRLGYLGLPSALSDQ